MENSEKYLKNISNISNSYDKDKEGLVIDLDEEEVDLLEQKKLRLENKRYKADTKDRRKLAKWAKRVVVTYLITVFVILLLNETWSSLFFNLSNTVLITLLGTTTLNILGLMYIVLKGYFHNKNKN